MFVFVFGALFGLNEMLCSFTPWVLERVRVRKTMFGASPGADYSNSGDGGGGREKEVPPLWYYLATGVSPCTCTVAART